MFEFLADLDNHWRLTSDFARVDRVPQGVDAPAGHLVLRGPFGIRRSVRTRLLGLDAPASITGEAAVGRRTRAQIEWALRPVDGAGPGPAATDVTLRTVIPTASAADRILLAVGGWWLRRRLADVLQALDRHVAGG